MVIQIWTLKMKARRNNTPQKSTLAFIYDFILFFILLNFIVTKRKVMFYRIPIANAAWTCGCLSLNSHEGHVTLTLGDWQLLVQRESTHTHLRSIRVTFPLTANCPTTMGYCGFPKPNPPRSPCSIASLNRRPMSRWSEHMSWSWLCSSTLSSAHIFDLSVVIALSVTVISHVWFLCPVLWFQMRFFFTPSAVINPVLGLENKKCEPLPLQH